MEKKFRPIVLSIAGFDPSGGAGTLTDIKTFECIGVYGLSVITALTLQSEKEFVDIQWRDIKKVTDEIHFLTQYYPINYAKIGILKDAEMLKEIMNTLKKQNIKIIWDTVLKSSTSKVFFEKNEISKIESVLKELYCITPNVNEALAITELSNVWEAGKTLSQYTNVLIKGGHNEKEKGTDYLFEYNRPEPIKIIPQTHHAVYPKHGSGCVYSSALTAYLASGHDLKTSAIKAKEYTENFLASSNTLIGYHSNIL
ncbi:MAG: hydroxymethylpyrimidine/phosphomethylpyrimidine kinase [Bacteroidia bacterium]|nr:MAG: hydroxymethylpyrimidine/phosphomethylpyrimidine kinase [Bacteroidia bacterium]